MSWLFLFVAMCAGALLAFVVAAVVANRVISAAFPEYEDSQGENS